MGCEDEMQVVCLLQSKRLIRTSEEHMGKFLECTLAETSSSADMLEV
jgi:hypothetical protein